MDIGGQKMIVFGRHSWKEFQRLLLSYAHLDYWATGYVPIPELNLDTRKWCFTRCMSLGSQCHRLAARVSGISGTQSTWHDNCLMALGLANAVLLKTSHTLH
jgi:hypothetical protein